MKILLVSATNLEIEPTIQHFEKTYRKLSFSEFIYNDLETTVLITGIGSMMMAFALARFPHTRNIDLVIHAGISGSYSNALELTEVVEVISEQWADLGAETVDGKFIDSYELGLMEKDKFPYSQGTLFKNRKTISTGLKQVAGLTVNKTSGSTASIDQIKKIFQADVESMEGAGLFYACNIMDIPFISIRAISNYVEPRDKSKWKLQEAIAKLNVTLIDLIENMATELLN